MISISPIINSKIYHSPKASQLRFSGASTDALIEKGDNALNNNKDEQALQTYKQALSIEPDNEIINRKLAKAQHKLKDYKSAEENLKIYLNKNPNDVQAWIELGEAQRQRGLYTIAIKSFEKALSLDNSDDVARRSILETKNNELSMFAPQRALAEKHAYAQKNLQEALNMTVNYMGAEYMKDLSNVQIKFGDTATMGGTANIAQYENAIKTITVSKTYQYASPQVIAAYLVHESVHAKDKDPYTSIKEEQDAYKIATKFWIQYSKGIKDPEMDYAADLYQKSPETLNKRVEEIYTLRDPDIARTSPNHPPQKKTIFNLPKKKAASQPLTAYDAIA